VIKVTQKEGEEVPTEVLASEIIAISAGIRKLRSGRLNDRALVLLIQSASPSDGSGQKITLSAIKSVLDGMSDLERMFIRKPAVASR
jgi:hypothetical protein